MTIDEYTKILSLVGDYYASGLRYGIAVMESGDTDKAAAATEKAREDLIAALTATIR